MKLSNLSTNGQRGNLIPFSQPQTPTDDSTKNKQQTPTNPIHNPQPARSIFQNAGNREQASERGGQRVAVDSAGWLTPAADAIFLK